MRWFLNDWPTVTLTSSFSTKRNDIFSRTESRCRPVATRYAGELMPGINLIIAGTPNAELTERVAEQIALLTCDVLKKELTRTRVIVRYVPEDQWFIAGRSLAKGKQKSYQLEVTITGETNTRTEKADFHSAAHALLKKLLGDVHPHSSIHIVDCSPTSYGYGGITQEHRYQHA